MSPPSRLSSLPSWLLTQLARHAQRLVSAGFAGAGARGYHYRLLAALREFGPTSQAELGRWCAIDRSDVVAAINELAAAGYVSRSPDPVDRRRNIVEITPAGERQAARLDEAVDGVQDELLAPLSAAERRQLTALLGRLLDHHAPPH
ncbi:MAG: MarR family transcriptional regulator [Actinophytocola sp.]|uniref:MarR family winged helix-turn-helix transcriptional regulator n=1 Tax=Actinophytocola sp. TaxID=1872138 RepID=UPI001323CFC4|nr:MarR family winged helix-turn-helix transcriptional regulator [Actinophytocola sp.]MPZ80199.1 MarR family transcriptional regulator [Actinophytocola sp.]